MDGKGLRRAQGTQKWGVGGRKESAGGQAAQKGVVETEESGARPVWSPGPRSQ